jgi:hypothetical protein
MTYLDDVGPVETILQFNLHRIVKLTISYERNTVSKITFISLLYYYHLLLWLRVGSQQQQRLPTPPFVDSPQRPGCRSTQALHHLLLAALCSQQLAFCNDYHSPSIAHSVRSTVCSDRLFSTVSQGTAQLDKEKI